MNNLLYFLPMAIVIGVAGLIKKYAPKESFAYLLVDVAGTILISSVAVILAFISFVLFFQGLINLTN